MTELKPIEKYPNYFTTLDGVIHGKRGVLSVYRHKKYPQVCLRKDGKAHWLQLNGLIAEIFIPNPENLKCVGHYDQDVQNCHPSNLYWKKCGPVIQFSSTDLKNRKKLRSIRILYGLEEKEYFELLIAQDYKCAICGIPEEKSPRRLHIDHAHAESKYVPKNAIRGLLCWECNHRLIAAHTDPEIFNKAAQYLRQHTGHIAPDHSKKRKRKRKPKK